MPADLVAGTVEKHKQSVAMVVTNRLFTVFPFWLLELLLDSDFVFRPGLLVSLFA